MISSPIIPAIIPTSLVDLEEQIAKISGLPEVHVDVDDGVFVPAVSWPYIDAGIPSAALKLLAPFSLEVDLMVENQLAAARAWLAAGADQLVFHCERISPEALELFSSEHDVTIGICALNDTPFSELARYLPVVDYAQVMGIAAIGSQGQPFDNRVFDRIAEIKNSFPQMAISIDGSINAETLPSLLRSGLSRFIVGSAIMGNLDPKNAYQELNQLALS